MFFKNLSKILMPSISSALVFPLIYKSLTYQPRLLVLLQILMMLLIWLCCWKLLLLILLPLLLLLLQPNRMIERILVVAKEKSIAHYMGMVVTLLQIVAV